MEPIFEKAYYEIIYRVYENFYFIFLTLFCVFLM
jgi:hypothetical protein